MTRANYNKKTTVSEKTYNEITRFIGGLFKRITYDDDFTYYTFDDAELQVVRMNRKERTTEISDRVTPEIIESINHIIRTGMKGADLMGAK